MFDLYHSSRTLSIVDEEISNTRTIPAGKHVWLEIEIVDKSSNSY